jgi:hypothetical protein
MLVQEQRRCRGVVCRAIEAFGPLKEGERQQRPFQIFDPRLFSAVIPARTMCNLYSTSNQQAIQDRVGRFRPS